MKIFHLVEYNLFGENPVGYNAANIILHSLVCSAVFLFLREDLNDGPAAFAAALLYAVNPTKVEAVSWVYSDFYIIAAFFSILSLYYYCRSRYIASQALFALSLLSKESSVVMPLIVLLYEYLIRSNRSWKSYIKTAPFFVITLLYLAARRVAVGAAPISDESIFTLLNGIAVITRLSVKIFFWPDAPITIYIYRKELFSNIHADTLISYVVVAALAATGVFLWLKNKRYLFWYLWFFVWLSIVFNVGKYGEFFMADKYLDVASLGFCVLAVLLLKDFTKNIRIYGLLIAGFFVLHFGVTFDRTLYWTDTFTYVKKGLEHAPSYYKFHYALGNEYVKRGDYDHAMAEYRRTVDLLPSFSPAYADMGNIHLIRGELQPALDAYGKAIYRDPSVPYTYYNVGLAMEKLGNAEKALEYYGKYLSLEPSPPASVLEKMNELRSRINSRQAGR